MTPPPLLIWDVCWVAGPSLILAGTLFARSIALPLAAGPSCPGPDWVSWDCLSPSHWTNIGQPGQHLATRPQSWTPEHTQYEYLTFNPAKYKPASYK